jgi:hypothetical protein
MMSFSLPLNFSKNVNQMGELILDFEAAVDETKKDECLRKALVLACQILSDVDLRQLKLSISDVFIDAENYRPNWFAEVVGDVKHFEYFLNNVESEVIDAAGVDKPTRDRILREIKLLRSAAVESHARVNPSSIVAGIEDLRTDVCAVKNQVIKQAGRSAMYTKLVKVLCVIAILANAVGPVISQTGSPAAFAASIAVGGIRFIPAS